MSANTGVRLASEHPAPLIMHIVYQFSVGGLENGLVNLVNRLPANLARHCILSLTTVDPLFAKRVAAPGVEFVQLRKPPGQTARILPAVYRELRRRRPALVHTRNLTALECQLAAALAGVPARVHGEHGWDMNDLHGANRRYALLRRLLAPLVHHQVALSARTHDYLRQTVGVHPERLSTVCNGVDVSRFKPQADDAPLALAAGAPAGWHRDDAFVVGTVGRLACVKNQRLLCDAFLRLRARDPVFRDRGRLLVVGEGPDSQSLRAMVEGAGAGTAAWFAGEHADVPRWLRAMDLFCLPSLAEGISNSILEAMACGRPVVATDVGGNRELVDDGVTGMLLSSIEPAALAGAIERYFDDPLLGIRHGSAGRSRTVSRFSLETMVGVYADLYARLLQPSGRARPALEKPSCAG
jgi:sugar transferase (PEP-CTERM/EpsH1 system associated)